MSAARSLAWLWLSTLLLTLSPQAARAAAAAQPPAAEGALDEALERVGEALEGCVQGAVRLDGAELTLAAEPGCASPSAAVWDAARAAGLTSDAGSPQRHLRRAAFDTPIGQLRLALEISGGQGGASPSLLRAALAGGAAGFRAQLRARGHGDGPLGLGNARLVQIDDDGGLVLFGGDLRKEDGTINVKVIVLSLLAGLVALALTLAALALVLFLIFGLGFAAVG